MTLDRFFALVASLSNDGANTQSHCSCAEDVVGRLLAPRLVSGGSFQTVPAPVYAGSPPVLVIATVTVALLLKYIAGALGFREVLQAPHGPTIVWSSRARDGGAASRGRANIGVLAATAGGYFGARMVRRLLPAVVSVGIVGIGLLMSAIFFAWGRLAWPMVL